MTGTAGKRNYLGEVRRSQVIGYGPGAIIDFRSGARGGGPVSIVAGSLDSWNDTAAIEGPDDPHILFEPRLQKVLQKNHFRQPPVDETDPGDEPDRQLRGYRFPAWLLCPECNRLDYSNRWGKTMGDAARWCEPCSARSGRRVFVVPTRFVTACVNGHLDEFPWHYWIRRAYSIGNGLGAKPKCLDSEDGKSSRCDFKLKSSGGSGLESLTLWCNECGAGAGMGQIFSQEALLGMRCSGREPWIEGNQTANCSETPRTMQRGASNLYFPVTYSALSIPPWSGNLFSELQQSWGALKRFPADMQNETIEVYAESYAGMHGMTPNEYAAHVRKLLEMEDELSADDIRPQEYSAIKMDQDEKSSEFKTRKESVPEEMSEHFRTLVRVQRLREVRALVSFKRIHPHVDLSNPGVGQFGRLSADESRIDWLPAIDVRGEGIFIEFSREKIEDWIASQPSVVSRIARLNDEYQDFLRRVTAQDDVDFNVSVTQVLVHSFSHAFIKRLAFEAGYDAASLRERIFVGDDPWMAGVLVYTSTPDADGTLGGLERQGLPDNMVKLVRGAVQDVDLCSSDPLCRRGVSSTSELLNLSACHNCLFLPETSCELGNRLLDRLLLVGEREPEGTQSSFEGYFSEYLEG
jgi:hypothetical protein